MKKMKNYAMALVALFIAIGSVTLMSFKNTVETENGWYEVQQINPNATNPNDPSNLQITSHLSSGLPSGGDCQATDVSIDRCAVYLDLSNFTATSPIGMSVSTATNPTNQGIIDLSSAGTLDGFAKKAED